MPSLKMEASRDPAAVFTVLLIFGILIFAAVFRFKRLTNLIGHTTAVDVF